MSYAKVGRADLVQVLEQFPLFYDFTHQEVARVAAYAEEIAFDPRETIFRLGEPAETIYLVVSGLVRLTADEATELGPEDFIVRSRAAFGEDCAVDESPRGIAAIALMRTQCLTFAPAALRKLEEEHPRTALKLIRKLARITSLRLRQAVGRKPPLPAVPASATTTVRTLPPQIARRLLGARAVVSAAVPAPGSPHVARGMGGFAAVRQMFSRLGGFAQAANR